MTQRDGCAVGVCMLCCTVQSFAPDALSIQYFYLQLEIMPELNADLLRVLSNKMDDAAKDDSNLRAELSQPEVTSTNVVRPLFYEDSTEMYDLLKSKGWHIALMPIGRQDVDDFHQDMAPGPQ